MTACTISADRLSLALREATASAHSEAEAALDLPASVRTRADYRDLLLRFYRIYLPLERILSSFDDWAEIGIVVAERTHSERLACDLQALGVDPAAVAPVPEGFLPRLNGFAQALGAMYVMEGSTLGSQVILRMLQQAPGAVTSGAESFLSGHGRQTKERWAEFCQSLDRYGGRPSANWSGVVEGARATFASVGAVMREYLPQGPQERRFAVQCGPHIGT